MSQKTRIGQLWGIVLAGGDGTRVRPFVKPSGIVSVQQAVEYFEEFL